MESRGLRILKAVPMVALGIGTFYLLFGRSEEALKVLEDGCPQNSLYAWRSGIAPLDKYLCILVAFFMQAESSEGQWANGYLLSILWSALAFIAVEGSRAKAGWLLSLTSLFALLAEVIGVSVAFPLVWLSAYFLYDSGNTDINQIWRRKISLARVAAIAFFMLFIILNSVALIFPFQERQKQTVALIFQLTPVLAPLGWLPFQTSAEAPQKGGHKGVIALHLLHAGYGLVWHLVAILYVIRDSELPARLFTILTSWRNDQYVVYFLLVDGLVLFLSLVYLAMVEHGVLVAISVLGGAFVFGPAFALSCYFVYREQLIAKAAGVALSKKGQ